MGEIFLARHEGPAGFAKTVVVKRIHKHLAKDGTLVDQFLDEARLAALLTHPNVVQVFELGEHEGDWFIAMEYIQGRSLRGLAEALHAKAEWVRPTLAAWIAAQALRGLHSAHAFTDDRGRQMRIVHRDVSPENVLVGIGGAVKVVDFGLARPMHEGAPEKLQGKFLYMPPEQLTNRGVDARTDVYAMGVVLYELLCGRRPRQAANPTELLRQFDEGEAFTPIDEHRADVPEPIIAAIEQALATHPGDRFATAHDFAVALEQAIASLGVVESPGTLDDFLKALFGDQLAPPLASEPKVGTAPLAGSQAVLTQFATRAGPPGAGTPPHADAPPARGARWPYAVGALAVVLLGLAVAYAFSDGPQGPPPPQPVAEVTPAVVELPLPQVPMEVADAPPDAGATFAELDLTPPEPAGLAGKKKRPATGTVVVRVHPWAEVIYAGRSLGTTPLKPVRVPAGRAVFTLRNRDLGIERQVTVTVPPGGQAPLTANLMERRKR